MTSKTPHRVLRAFSTSLLLEIVVIKILGMFAVPTHEAISNSLCNSHLYKCATIRFKKSFLEEKIIFQLQDSNPRISDSRLLASLHFPIYHIADVFCWTSKVTKTTVVVCSHWQNYPESEHPTELPYYPELQDHLIIFFSPNIALFRLHQYYEI